MSFTHTFSSSLTTLFQDCYSDGRVPPWPLPQISMAILSSELSGRSHARGCGGSPVAGRWVRWRERVHVMRGHFSNFNTVNFLLLNTLSLELRGVFIFQT